MGALIKKFFIMCSGANQEILKRPECAIELPKYIGIGATIFFTAIISFLSASYALYLAFRSAILSVLFGLLWSLIVFNLDRYLILTLKRKRTPANLSFAQRLGQRSNELFVSIPRFLLTLLISLTVAIPLELKLFERDIEAQIALNKSNVRVKIEEGVLKEFPDIDRLRSENERLQQEIYNKQKQINDLQQLVLDRTKEPSALRLYKDRKKALEESEKELQKLRETNQQKISANTATLEHLQAEAHTRAKEAFDTFEEGNGLLARFEALNKLKSQSQTIAIASLFIVALFVFLLSSPVLLKLLSDVGPYEHFWMTIETMANKETRSPLIHEGASSTSPGSEQLNMDRGSLKKNNATLSLRSLRVFLCHSSSDKPTIRDLYQRLTHDGIDPWLDEENILPGQDWSNEIIAAVRSCDVVIVCLSRGSISRAGFLQREIRFALEVATEQPEGAIFLIPAKLEECDVPRTLRQLQWVNLFEETGYQKLMLALRSRALALGAAIGSGS